MVRFGHRRFQLFIKVKFGHTWSKEVAGGHRGLKLSLEVTARQRGIIWSHLAIEVAGGHRGLIWSHLVIGGHIWSQRSNMVTLGYRRSQLVTEV